MTTPPDDPRTEPTRRVPIGVLPQRPARRTPRLAAADPGGHRPGHGRHSADHDGGHPRNACTATSLARCSTWSGPHIHDLRHRGSVRGEEPPVGLLAGFPAFGDGPGGPSSPDTGQPHSDPSTRQDSRHLCRAFQADAHGCRVGKSIGGTLGRLRGAGGAGRWLTAPWLLPRREPRSGSCRPWDATRGTSGANVDGEADEGHLPRGAVVRWSFGGADPGGSLVCVR